MVHRYPDPCLRVTAEAVTPGSPEAWEAARCLREAFAQVEGLGLAATQLGLPVRVILVEIGEQQLVLINPQIVACSADRVVETEGCLSFPGLQAGVARAAAVKVKALDEDGAPVELNLEQLEARLLQHEVDHLDGVLFVDHLPASIRRQLLVDYEGSKEVAPSATT